MQCEKQEHAQFTSKYMTLVDKKVIPYNVTTLV